MSAPLVHAKPAGKIVFQKEDSWKEKCFSRIDSHDLNFAVDILLPGCAELPSDLERVLTEQPVFLAQQVPLAKLVTEEFRCCFVKRGKIYGLSQGTAIDGNDCVAILPNGTLVLHLTKDTYQELGLEGRLSMFETGTRKHVVEINMASDSFSPGKKFYERVKWCLTDRLNLKFDLLFTWEPNLNTVCPTSIQGYFQANNIICNRIQLTKRLQLIKDLSVPRLCHSDPQNKAENNCSYLDAYEWLGACAVGADLEDLRPDKYISSYTCPDPSEKIRECVCVSYQGMLTPTTIRNAVQCIRVFRERKGQPWCSVTVHGFMDSPVTECGREHGFFNNGDNLYTYILFPDGPWVYTALGGKDVYT